MPFWDDENSGNSGWAAQATEAAAPTQAAKPKPTHEEIASAWNANKNDPAKIYELMHQYGVGVKDLSQELGVGQNDIANYLNSGRRATQERSGSGDDMQINDVYNYGESHREAQTRDEFDKTVQPWMLDANGKFKGPKADVNYRWEGMTPDQVFAQNQPAAYDPNQERDGHTQGLGPGQDRLAYYGETHGGTYGGGGSSAIAAPWDPINLNWEAGPDNGGGGLAAVGRAIGNVGTGIVNNPAAMAALTAGATPYVSDGLQSVGMSASTANTAAPFVVNAGKTLASGGNLGDVARSAAATYAGNQATGIIGGATGSDTLGNIGGSVVSSAIRGGDPLRALISSGASAAAGQITGNIDGFASLSQSQQSMINGLVSSALQGKNPTQALINSVTQMATSRVSNSTPARSNTTTGGWAA